MNKETPIGRNVKKIRKQLGLNQLDLALKLRVSDSYISRIESGAISSPGPDVIIKIADALNVSIGELFGEETQKAPTRLIPMLDMVQAGEWTEINDHPYPGIADEYVETDLTAPRLFALRVRGASMEPIFHEGETLIINPDLQPEVGNYVVAKLDDEAEATFKQLKRVGTVYFLHPLNPAFENIPVTKKVRIVGKMVRSQRDW